MAPGGPRSHPSQQPGYGARPPPPGAGTGRNEVFENIFGRPSAGHHLGQGPPGHPQRPGYPSGPGGNVLNPAQPSYPPQFPNHQQPPPPQQQQQRYPQPPGPGQPQRQPPQRVPYQQVPDPYAQQQPSQSAYDGVSLYDGNPNGGYSRPRGSSYGQGEVPSRRTSLMPSRTPSQSSQHYPNNPAQNGARVPPPSAGYNGYAGLTPVADGYPSGSAMQMPQPQPRSVSATSASSSSTITTNVPPRSRSLHHSNGPSKIRVSIPSPNLGDSLTPFPERYEEQPPSTRADDPPDYLRAMSSMNLDNSPGRTEDMTSPDRDFTISGPWDSPYGGDTEHRPNSSRHMSSGSVSSQRRSMHARQPSDSSITSSIYTVGAVSGRMAPLSQITNPDTPDSLQEPPTPTGSENGFTSFSRLSGRKSMESTHSLPLPSSTGVPESPLPPGAATSVFDHRALSFSGSGVNRRDVISAVRSSNSTGVSSLYGGNNPSSPVASQKALTHGQSGARAKPVFSGPIIVALLSNVAEAFRQYIEPTDIVKDGIAYKDAFEGRTAVSIIADIIKTPDRNLALLLGRALDAQKFFHDVTYAHRLRDSEKEVYQFRERLVAPFMSGVMDSPSSDHLGLTTRPSSSNSTAPKRPALDSASVKASDSQGSFFAPKASPSAAITPIADEEFDDDLPNGVFTLLTECYSPTCSRERLCYSINCPRRMEQMKRLNMKSAHPGLQSKLEDQSLVEDVKDSGGTLWIHTVSQEILDSVDDTEKKRQEAINEIMYTERDFVRALEYLRDSWVKPLRANEDVIPVERREEFVRNVFWNVHDVLKVNQVLAERLTKRQKSKPVVEAIGDIFLEFVPHFEPFVVYGAHQLFGKYEFEKEKGSNPAFQKFVDETERKPESQKLELNGYLTKPTTRLGRYPLLLEAVLKYTPDDHPDKKDLPEAIRMIRAFLTKVNVESGKSENIFELAQLDSQLIPPRGQEKCELHLRAPNRQLVHKGPMKRRGGTQGENADLLAFLFDHAFLLVKSKWVNKSTEQYRIYRKPINLEHLVLSVPEDYNNSAKLSASSRSKLITRNASKGNQLVHVPPKPESKHGFSLTVTKLGRHGFSLQLWVETYVNRKKWVDMIEKGQQELRDQSTIFVPETVTRGFFLGLRRINCLSPYDNGNRMIYGTDEGVYFSNLRDPKLREPVKVINLVDVTQVDVIEELQLLIVLHERSVTTFPLDCLDPNDPNQALKRGKRVSSHTSFFKSGICLGRTLVAIVKSSPLSSTIKVLEPVDQNTRGKKQQTGFMRRLNGGQDTLKVFKEFYIPLESFSVHFLKTKICVGCQKGFEIVDLETLDMQSLLDPSDSALNFVLKREGVRPMAIYRIEGDFLLCYDEFAFYVNKNGYRARPSWHIIWGGTPTAFALQYPYVIAFEPTFIEVHHVESGALIQVIPGNNISCLFADMPPSTVNAPPPSRQMYPGPGRGGMYRPPGPGPQGYPQGYGGYPQPPPQFQQPPQMGPGRPPMGGYMQPQPMAPFRNFLYRPQVIFTSDDGHVQFLKLPPRDRRRSSDSRAPSIMSGSTAVSHASSTTLR